MAYLNRFLTTFRQRAIDAKYPKRGKGSDGWIGDAKHSASVSQHNPDSDGSVDAIDIDVNLLGSNVETGTAAEKAEVRKVLAEFQKQPEAQLWIYDSHIANRDVGNWKVRWYGNWSSGKNPHDKHAHLQSRQSRETESYESANTDKVVDAPVKAPVAKPASAGGAPKYSGRVYKAGAGYSTEVKVWQAQMRKRGWKITVDGFFGKASAEILRKFQAEKKLGVDGRLGPKSFAAAWTAKVTK